MSEPLFDNIMPRIDGPPASSAHKALPVIKKKYTEIYPYLPKPHNYGMCKQQREQENIYLLALRDKPPIEYIAEFLCNIFKYNKNKETGEEYFCDGMGRTFYETIIAMFISNESNYEKLSQLRKEFKYRAYDSSGNYAVFGSNYVTIHEMRNFIKWFYNYFQENNDMYFSYYIFQYYYRSHENRPSPPLMYEFIK